MSSAKKFYAVARGRRPGIYRSWAETQVQVHGFAGALFKGFGERAEAEAWLRNPVLAAKKGGEHTARTAAALSPAAVSAAVHIYTDGGSIGNPGPGGYGVVIIDGGTSREFSGGFRLTTNNRMELMACIVALRQLGRVEESVLVTSDSSYVVNGMSKGWAVSWRARGWRKADGSAAINADLWAELLDLSAALDIRFHWIKGHAGHPENERCDRLAVAAARGRDLPADQEYERLRAASASGLPFQRGSRRETG